MRRYAVNNKNHTSLFHNFNSCCPLLWLDFAKSITLKLLEISTCSLFWTNIYLGSFHPLYRFSCCFFYLKALILHIKLREWSIDHYASTYSVLTLTLDLRHGVKTFFSEILHIKLKGMEHRATCKHIFWLYTYPLPLGMWSIGQNIFTESSQVVYQIKGMAHRASHNHIFLPYTNHQYVGRDKRYNKSECGHVAYQIKGKEVSTNKEAKNLTLRTPLTSGSGWKVRYWKCTDKFIFIELSTEN